MNAVSQPFVFLNLNEDIKTCMYGDKLILTADAVRQRQATKGLQSRLCVYMATRLDEEEEQKSRKMLTNGHSH